MTARCAPGCEAVNRTRAVVVGGKAAHLGELSRIEGIRVPAGYCVTTDAFRRIMAEAPSIDERLDETVSPWPGRREAIGRLSTEIRRSRAAIRPGRVPP